jgi:hypothetical protein
MIQIPHLIPIQAEGCMPRQEVRGGLDVWPNVRARHKQWPLQSIRNSRVLVARLAEMGEANAEPEPHPQLVVQSLDDVERLDAFERSFSPIGLAAA